MSQEYHAEAVRGLRWNDPGLAIHWPECAERVVSAKDLCFPDWSPWKRS
jgi:dTDP-4-dehydrorhamnose 3,5-epimerase